MTAQVVGVLLAGGQSRRMGGGDKCLLPLAGKPLLHHVIDRLAPQVAALVLNANGDPARFASFGLPVVADPVGDYAGPLAGVLAGMEWAGVHRPDARWIATAATDTPFFPDDLVTRLLAATEDRYPAIALAASDGREHPVFGLWPTALAADLRQALAAGTRKVLDWTGRHVTVTAAFGPAAVGAATVDPFTNVNRPEELARAEALLAGLAPAGRPPIFGVVGWKKSGKTTLVAGLIAEMTRRGYRVAAMKHAHHAFDIDHPGRDTHRFRESGARQVAIGSSRRLAVLADLALGEREPDFSELVTRIGPCDLILVEGWKRVPFPKVETRSARTLTREPLTKDDPHIVAIAADTETDGGGLPVFDLGDIAGIADFIEEHLALTRRAAS